MNKLKLGIPKGSLQDSTISLFKKAGFEIIASERTYYPSINDPEIECLMIRAQEMPKYVENGALDCGITGQDWIEEMAVDIHEVSELIYAKQGMRPVRWVLAVPTDSSIKSVRDLQGKRVATELVNVSRKYLKKNKVTADVEFSWGATEVKPPQLADAIIDVTETGASLKANNLKIVDTVMESTTRFVANNTAWKDPWKKQKMEQIALLVNGAINAIEKVGLKMNVSKKDLNKVVALLPSLKSPTINPLQDSAWVAVEAIATEKLVRDLLP